MDTEEIKPEKSKKTVLQLLLVVVAMFGFGFAMVPIYSVFCDITGINGNTSSVKTVTTKHYAVDENRTVRVQFVATLNNSMYWEFTPKQFELQVHPGKLYTTEFSARNLRDETVIGQAIPSVMPGIAALHFHKTECFCFTQQQFKAGEYRNMPVTFVIDPSLPEDVTTVTLSYTFFDVTQSAGKGNPVTISPSKQSI